MRETHKVADTGESITRVNTEQFRDLDDALAKIQVARPFDDITRDILASATRRAAEWSLLLAFLMSASSRARALYEAASREIACANPPASITLLRQLSETVAMTFYVSDYPAYVEVLAQSPRVRAKGSAKRKTVQALISHMDRNYTSQFADVYAEMCEMTHFGTSALWSSHRLHESDDATARVGWRSEPQWKSDDDGLISCALLLELHGGMTTGLIQLGETLLASLEET